MPAGGTPPDPYNDPKGYRKWRIEWYGSTSTMSDRELTEAIAAEAARVMRLRAEQGLD